MVRTERKGTAPQLRRGNERLELLSDVAARLLATDNPLEVVHDICATVMAHLDCQVYVHYLVDPPTGELHLNASAGFTSEQLRAIACLDIGVGISGCVARDGRRIIVDDLQHTADPRTALLQSFGLQAYACHPLLAGDRVIGTLAFGAATRTAFTPDELALMKTITDQMAIKLERAHVQLALRESEATMRAILDAVQESIYLFAVDGTILAANSSAINHLARDQEDVLGHHFSEFVPAHLVTARRERLQEVSTSRRPIRFEDEWDGVIFDNHFYPVFDGDRVSRIAAFSQNITASKQIEEALEKTSAGLTRSNKELEQFAYVASHDLQEPLRAVSGFVSLLEERWRDRLDAKDQQFINGAVQGATRMQRLISDLLALSRVGTQGKAFAPVDMNVILDLALQSISTSIRETGATITHTPLPTMIADAGQMGQLLQNLLTNALKFHGDRPPRIHLAAERRDTGWLFTVRDEGIGIEPQYYQRIFLIFQRLHTRLQYPGTGIGLAICQKIIERHGGTIWVESEPGSGTTFFFTLPSRGT